MRVLHYSHDDYGMDNLQQTIAIAERMDFEFPETTQLLVTESPQAFGIKLPRKGGSIKASSRPESLGEKAHVSPSLLPFQVIKSLRKTFIFDAIRCFKADVILVQTPREVQVAFFHRLNYFHQTHIKTKLVLGNGDIENTLVMIQDAFAGTRSKQDDLSYSH